LNVLRILQSLLIGTAAAAAPTSTMTARVDPRIELLGVIQYLAGRHKHGPEIPSYIAGIDRRFKNFRGHPAVKSYRDLADKARGEEGLAVIVFCLSDPPELSWTCAPPLRPKEHIEMVGGEQASDLLLTELRDFARASDFQGFLDGHRKEYSSYEDAVRQELKDRDYLSLIEDYVGPLHSRLNVILSLAYRSGQLSYIIPYPFAGAKVQVSGPFDVFTLMEPQVVAGKPRFAIGGFWHELLCVAIDPILTEHCEEIDGLSYLRGAVAKQCQPQWFPCATNLINAAVLDRLSLKLGISGPFGTPVWPQNSYGDYGRALSRSLEDYEKRRDLYPSLREFYPQLMSAFSGLAQGFTGTKPAPGPSQCGSPGDKAITTAPEPAPAEAGKPLTGPQLRERGVWNFVHERLEAAENDFRAALKIDPGDAEAHLDLGVALDKDGQLDQAIAQAAEAVRLANGVNPALAAQALSTRDSLLEKRAKSANP
jgi:tetratricopeptide (TPR) repeat protein